MNQKRTHWALQCCSCTSKVRTNHSLLQGLKTAWQSFYIEFRISYLFIQLQWTMRLLEGAVFLIYVLRVILNNSIEKDLSRDTQPRNHISKAALCFNGSFYTINICQQNIGSIQHSECFCLNWIIINVFKDSNHTHDTTKVIVLHFFNLHSNQLCVECK